MKRIVWFVPIVFLSLQMAQASNEARRPNVVVIMADDLGYGDIGAYRELYQGGDPDGLAYLHTPELDKLAREGVRCTRAYTAPWCAPSRQGLLSGRWVNRADAYAYPWIGQQMRAQGYATGTAGKHHGDKPIQKTYGNTNPETAEFASGFFFNGGARGYFLRPGESFPVRKNFVASRYEAKGGEYLTDVFTDFAVEFIRDHAEEPFLLYLPYTAPHAPLQGKPADLRALFPEAVKGMSDAQIDQDKSGRMHDMHYAAMVYALDRGVGRIKKTLQDLGIDRCTTIIFTSDNGTQPGAGSNYPLTGHKWDPLEGGIRVPFIVWSADFAQQGCAGSVYDGLVSHVDIAPTISALAGCAEHPCPTDGINMMPYWTRQQPVRTGRRFFFADAGYSFQLSDCQSFSDQPYSRDVRIMHGALVADTAKIYYYHPNASSEIGLVYKSVANAAGAANPQDLLFERTPVKGAKPDSPEGRALLNELVSMIKTSDGNLLPQWSGSGDAHNYQWWTDSISIVENGSN